MTHLDRAHQTKKATERRITAALVCSACIVGFAWMTFIVLNSFAAVDRRVVETFAGEGVIMAFAILALLQLFRRRG